MTPLPEAPAAPLHVLPPWIEVAAALVVLAAVMALVVGVLLRRYLKRRDGAVEPVRRPVGRARGSFAEIVQTLLEDHLRRHAYREGCHALSAAVKTRLGRRFGIAAEEMTAVEIKQVLGQPRFARFLEELRDHQFGRRPPVRGDLDRMCRKATRLLDQAEGG